MSMIQMAVGFYKKLGLHENARMHEYLRGLNRWRLSLGSRFHLRGEGNQVIWDGAILRNVTINITGTNNCIRISPGAYLSKVNMYVTGSNHRLSIGPGCRLNNGGNFWFQDENCRLEIGANTTLESFTICLVEPDVSITIGDDCMFSDGVDLRTADSHSVIDLATGKRTNWAASIHVGNHVWVAMHARISKGVTIGSNSVVAAASLVTRDVPPNSLVGGIPARVLRENYSWARERLGPHDVRKITDGTSPD